MNIVYSSKILNKIKQILVLLFFLIFTSLLFNFIKNDLKKNRVIHFLLNLVMRMA